MSVILRQLKGVKHLQQTTSRDDSVLSTEQMQALEKAVAFLREAMARTGGTHFKITEATISPMRVVGRIELQILIDDSTKPA